MKKIISYSALVLTLVIVIQFALIAQPDTESVKVKGTISADNDNSNNETDPQFKGLVNTTAFHKQLSKPGSTKHLSEVENGLQIVKDIINKMIQQQYRFSLLHQHKYMINDCLGLKVSAGEFDLRFGQPVVEISNTGKIKIKLEVERINLSALKVRMRPRSPDFSDPNPCHFSGKFEIGGEVTDLVMRAEINPLAQALTGAPGYCFLAFSEEPVIKWTIGGINLKPLQNNLDAIGKNMIEDALNNGMSQFFYTRFVEVSRAILPEYFNACEQAYSANKDVISSLPTAMTSENATDNDKSSDNENRKWVISTVPGMKGVLGKLNTNFPADVEWSIDVRSTENKFITNRSSYSKHGPSQDIAPGNYIFVLNTIPVENVPIEKGRETRLKAGVLSIVSGGNWEIRSDDKKKFHTSGSKPKKIALPLGNYQLELGGQLFPINIKDGETVEM